MADNQHIDTQHLTRRRASQIIALTNQKGGVGKTTTAVNLGAALALRGARVLLIDLDPQGNASTGLGVPRNEREKSSYDLLFDEVNITDCIVNSQVDGLDLIPASADLVGAEVELAETQGREAKIRQALGQITQKTDESRGGNGGMVARGVYDYILMDCPPSLGVMTLNALVAAHSVLIPLQCEFFALEGLSQLMQTLEKVRGRFNRTLHIKGVALTLYDKRNNLTHLVAEDVKSFFGDQVFDTLIPRNVRLSEAPSHGKPVVTYEKNCAGSTAYMDLADELLRRDGLTGRHDVSDEEENAQERKSA